MVKSLSSASPVEGVVITVLVVVERAVVAALVIVESLVVTVCVVVDSVLIAIIVAFVSTAYTTWRRPQSK